MEIKEYIDRLDWFIKNKSDTEENLKDDVVVWFLEKIGYNKDLFERETNCRKDKKDTHTDIFYRWIIHHNTELSLDSTSLRKVSSILGIFYRLRLNGWFLIPR